MKITKYNALLYEFLMYKVFTYYIEQVEGLTDEEMILKYKPYAYYARHLMDNLDGVYIRILELWMPIDELFKLDCWNELAKKRDLLEQYKRHCFEYAGRPGVYRPLNLEQQNEKAKKHMHFDFSSKKPKSFGGVKNER